MDSRLAAHDNPGDIAKVVIPNPSAAPNRGSTGIVRRLLIFLAILSLLAAGFMTIHRIVSKEVRRSIEGADLRSLRDIWANVETDLPPESLKDIQAFITNFESHTGVRYDLWLSSLDPVVKALGYEAVGSELRLPEGTGVTKQQVLESLMNPSAGAIAVLQAGTLNKTVSEGVMDAVRKLRAKGYKFAKLSDYVLE